MTSATHAKIVTKSVSIGKVSRDTVRFDELLMLVTAGGHEHTCRIQIVSNSYDFQGSAVLQRWDGDSWQEVWSLPALAMDTASGLSYVRDGVGKREYFAGDRATLISYAQGVL
jgi:hypothetical protein